MNLKIDENALFIINILEEEGFSAYVVGGCVRDSILGYKPKDWDITTSATTEQMKKVFKKKNMKIIPIGERFGTLAIIIDKNQYEVTTFRTESDYKDHRKPDKVEFTDSIIKDLERRDFTINSMAYSHSRGLVDPYDGFSDLKKGVIKVVGDEHRFEEDALRILRGIRFAVRYNFNIDPYTIKSMTKYSKNLKSISSERVVSEVNKVFNTFIKEDNDINLLVYLVNMLKENVIPELKMLNCNQINPYHKYGVFEHTIMAIANSTPNYLIRWALLFHDLGKRDTMTRDENGITHFPKHHMLSARLAEDITKNLHMSCKERETIERLVKYHDVYNIDDIKLIRKYISKYGKEFVRMLIEVRNADILAQSDKSIMEKSGFYARAINNFIEVSNEKQVPKINNLALSGEDVMKIMNIKPSPKVGEILRYLLDKVIENPELNQKNKLIEIINTKYGGKV